MARNLYNRSIKNTLRCHHKTELHLYNYKGDLKNAWKIIINQTVNKNPKSNKIMEMRDNNNNDIKLEDIPNAFNKHFVELGHNLSQSLPIPKFSPHHYVKRVEEQFNFNFCEISQSEILKLLLGISPNKAIDLDNLSAKLIKLAAPSIADPLTIIFNKSISTGVFPYEWKISKVIPVFKDGEKSNMNNYRP